MSANSLSAPAGSAQAISGQTVPGHAVPGRAYRVESIDLLRGIVMVIMALDHVRDYFHAGAYLYDPTDLQHTSAAVFFTRWITHFCAPVFMLLAGVAAWLYGSRRSRRELSFFLFTRGIWLILAELFIVTLLWTFNLLYPVYILQVIWAFGFSMIALALLVRLPFPLIPLIGLVLIAGHNLLDPVHVAGNGGSAFLWAFLHEQHYFQFGGLGCFVGYPILPWIGIIALGYGIGSWYGSGYDPAKRRRQLLWYGLAAVGLFVLLRGINIYGNPTQWSEQRSGLFTFLSFLNVAKYPPSLLYILMTLGPALVFLALSERPLNAVTSKLAVFGRVPMFYYLVHILYIHLLALLGAAWTGHSWKDMVVTGWVTASPALRGYGFGLPVVYGIWIFVVLTLYPLCKWFDGYKRSHVGQQRWLSYF